MRAGAKRLAGGLGPLPGLFDRAARRRERGGWVVHALLAATVVVVAFPLYYAVAVSTQSLPEMLSRPPRLLPSTHAVENYVAAWERAKMGRLLLNSAVVAVSIAVGKITISMLSAFAIVYFRFPLRQLVFWMVFVTLMLPIPVRLVSTYEVVSQLGWINSYTGLTIPLLASATATFLFRQFYRTVPDELAEAAQLDGAGPLRFLRSVLLPLSGANIAALFVILFIYGWNEYLWPLMITTTEEMRVVVIGLEAITPRHGTELPRYNVLMAAAVMALLPPVLVVLAMQRWFVRGLAESDR